GQARRSAPRRSPLEHGNARVARSRGDQTTKGDPQSDERHLHGYPVYLTNASSNGTPNRGEKDMTQKRGLGWLPDVPKPNDYHPYHPEIHRLLQKTKLGAQLGASAIEAPMPAALPMSMDLRAGFSPIEDQGPIGSCTANAAVGLLEYLERRAGGHFVDASRLFLYKVERNLLGWTGDTGAYLRTAMEAMVLFGAPPERYWAYDVTQYDAEPTPFCYAFGQNYKTLRYFRLDPDATSPQQILSNIKLFVAHHFPVMFGFPVYSDYDNPLPGALIPFPGPSSIYRGGHANVIAGYDDNKIINGEKGALLVRNSWGTAWGDAGYGWLSYKYVSAGYADDFWTGIKLDWVNTGNF
ncbi:MAG TPA: C1 family peptidase, partial [Polyangiaceae bacterium]|nr:C1 family peptidase [Polyangiaceae bacterium]